jgi:hypothetical protein
MKDKFGTPLKTYKDYVRDAWNRKEKDFAYYKTLCPKKDEGWEMWEINRLYHDEE